MDTKLSHQQTQTDQSSQDEMSNSESSEAHSQSVQQTSPQTGQGSVKQEHSPSQTDPTDEWALQVDRMAIQSPLIECFRILAGFYGRRTSVGSLIAGLPISKNGITPQLFERIAERADMQSRLVERSLDSLSIAPTFPCILVLKDQQACLVWDVDQGADADDAKEGRERAQALQDQSEIKFLVQFCETAEEKQAMTLSELSALYTGYAFFVRPIARNDGRAGPAEIDNTRDWFWAVLKKNKILYSEVIVASIMINLFGIASSIYIMNVYDRVVPNNAFDTLYAMSAGIFIVYVFDFILKNLRAHFLDYAGKKADVKISAMLFEQIMGMTMTARPPSAGVLASHMKEFETLRDFFTSATIATLIDLPFILVFIGIIALVGGPIAFVPLAAIPLVVGMGFYLQKPLQKVMRESLMESALKNALLFETIIGLETIKVQASEGNAQRKWEELTEKASTTAVKSKRLATFAQHWAAFIQQLVSVGIVFVGVFMISNGSITMGGLIAAVLLSGRAMAPLAQIAGLMTRLNQSREALVQLDDLMKKDVERPKDKHFVSMPHITGKIEFRDVVFNYPGQSVPSVDKINFTIQPGERLGIIGAVGSGKTTLERLLINLYEPTSGSVQIDGTDVRQIEPGDLRRCVGAVQQSPQLFHGTVRENITMGHEMAPDRAVMKAAELSGVMEFLQNTPTGLDTQVGERGEALSGGQRQAVAIARALLYDPPILVLDEPTASMDPASESRLRKRLDKLCENKTVILITHKGAMLGLVDKLMLLDHGKIVALGPKDEVIKKLQARQFGTSAENTDA